MAKAFEIDDFDLKTPVKSGLLLHTRVGLFNSKAIPSAIKNWFLKSGLSLKPNLAQFWLKFM
jgi:hypothetical protein